MFPLKVNWLFIALTGVLIASLWGWHHTSVKSAVRAAEGSLQAKYQEKLDKSIQGAINKTKELQTSADTLKDKKYEKLQSINAQLASNYRSLQQRTNRSTHLAPNPPTGSTCTAAQLYREDAEFLAGEAARAESILTERDYYYERYESVRKGISSN